MVKARETEKELDNLKRRVSQIDSDIQKQTANLRTAPDVVKQSIYADIEALDNEREMSRQQINHILAYSKVQDGRIADIDKAKQTIMDLPQLLQLVDYEGKLQLLRKVLEYVIVDGDMVQIF